MKLQNKKRSKIKLSTFLLLGLILIVIGYFVWQFISSQDNPSVEITQDHETVIQDDRIYTDTSEGAEITVPDDVDPSSIQDYNLITENETYKIRELNGEYYITLYAIINRPDQTEMYHDQLRQYKQDALNYLETKNINITEVEIHYEPSEAADL
jgi:hypothetical protein